MGPRPGEQNRTESAVGRSSASRVARPWTQAATLPSLSAVCPLSSREDPISTLGAVGTLEAGCRLIPPPQPCDLGKACNPLGLQPASSVSRFKQTLKS